MECFSWSPLDLSKKYQFNLGNYALIILNRPIVLPPNEMMTLWKEGNKIYIILFSILKCVRL